MSAIEWWPNKLPILLTSVEPIYSDMDVMKQLAINSCCVESSHLQNPGWTMGEWPPAKQKLWLQVMECDLCPITAQRVAGTNILTSFLFHFGQSVSAFHWLNPTDRGQGTRVLWLKTHRGQTPAKESRWEEGREWFGGKNRKFQANRVGSCNFNGDRVSR